MGVSVRQLLKQSGIVHNFSRPGKSVFLVSFKLIRLTHSKKKKNYAF